MFKQLYTKRLLAIAGLCLLGMLFQGCTDREHEESPPQQPTAEGDQPGFDEPLDPLNELLLKDPAHLKGFRGSEDPAQDSTERIVRQTADEGYHRVQVFFATNRGRNEASGPNRRYNGQRNREGPIEYGSAEVSIPFIHTLGTVERPSWYKLQAKEDPEKHVVILKLAEIDHPRFFSELKSLSEASRNEGLVFIHGFNVGFDDALRRTAQIAFDLDFGGVPITFSWPSLSSPNAYLYDYGNADWSIPHLAEFLIDLQENTGLAKIHIIAHSMGARLLSNAMAEAVDQGFDLAVNNVILAAPDIDADIFAEQILPKIDNNTSRVTMYASSSDVALKLSMRLHGHPRLGLSGSSIAVFNGMDTVNASGVDTSGLGHGYYGSHERVIKDIFKMIAKDLRPPERQLILGESGDWSFPVPISPGN